MIQHHTGLGRIVYVYAHSTIYVCACGFYCDDEDVDHSGCE